MRGGRAVRAALLVVLLFAFAGSALSDGEETTEELQETTAELQETTEEIDSATTTTTPVVLPQPTRSSAVEETAGALPNRGE